MPELTVPELCVVVLSYRNQDTIDRAVGSLLDQDVPLEIVIVHSGPGKVPFPPPGVRLLTSDRRLFPGAARNAGVLATRAPFVAFLAGDCVAKPGWAGGRLAHHRRGAQAVASALEPMVGAPASLAAHLLLYSFRMAHLEMPPESRFGVSYSRDLLERFGPFPENLVSGEDPALNDRLVAAGVELLWEPRVVTAHGYPTTAGGLIRDLHARGRRSVGLHRRPDRRALIAFGSLGVPFKGLRRAFMQDSPVRWRDAVRAAPLMVLGSLSALAGLLRVTPTAIASPERESLRRRSWFVRAGVVGSERGE